MKIFLEVIVYITTTYRVERLVRRTIINMAAGGPYGVTHGIAKLANENIVCLSVLFKREISRVGK